MKDKSSIRLKMQGLPVIQSLDDFSQITHISKYTIYQLSKNNDKYYKVYTIPKSNSKQYRTISQPSRKLKGLQSWILVNILNQLQVSDSCKGFEKESSTLDNAEPHKSANTILTIDLKDFFDSISSKNIHSIFKTAGYNSLISTILTNLTTYNNCLPQGGCCSPKLANLSTWSLDIRIQGYAGKRGITYTRYADDLTFSGLNPGKVVKIIPMMKYIISDEGFKINPEKTRIASSARAKKVTGLILSNNNVGIGKKSYNKLRSKIYHLTKTESQKKSRLINEVNGWLSYLYSVDKNRLETAIKYILKLQEKFPNTLVTKIPKIIW